MFVFGKAFDDRYFQTEQNYNIYPTINQIS
jgi:hypothetical protein